MLWSRVSKAFDKSRYTLMGVVPLSKCCVILSTSSNTASSVECSFLKCCLQLFYTNYQLDRHSVAICLGS